MDNEGGGSCKFDNFHGRHICIVPEKVLLRITKIRNFLGLKSLHPDQFLESSNLRNIDF